MKQKEKKKCFFKNKNKKSLTWLKRNKSDRLTKKKNPF